MAGLVEAATRLCAGPCGEEKPLDDFPTYWSKERGRRYRRNNCRSCRAAYARAFHATPERCRRQKDTWLRKAYGITIEQYDAMLEEQNGVCAICESTPGRLALAVDHDHETSAVRGLLCDGCNTAIGRFQDDPALLRAAADYLEAQR